MIFWENSWAFWLLLFVVVLILIFLFNYFRNKRLLNRFAQTELLNQLIFDYSPSKPLVKFFVLVGGLVFLILTLANPQIGTKLVEGKRQGIDVVIAIDVSNSMLAEDIKPNRLERAKQMVMRLIDKLVDDRIGIIVFAGEAYVQLPLTTDYSAAKLFTSYIDTDIVPTQGTAIGSAIGLAVEKFNFDEKRKKALIIITDGENHDDDPFSAAELAVKNNFVIHTIGMGTSTGGPIPIYVNGKKDFLKDNTGSVVTTRLDPIMLEKIASIGGGEFVLNSGVDPDLSQIVDKIAKMEKKEYETKIFSNFESQYQYPLAIALLFLIVELFITERRNKLVLILNSFVQRNTIRG
jgi:Ca-activated chloride channel family protein